MNNAREVKKAMNISTSNRYVIRQERYYRDAKYNIV